MGCPPLHTSVSLKHKANGSYELLYGVLEGLGLGCMGILPQTIIPAPPTETLVSYCVGQVLRTLGKEFS